MKVAGIDAQIQRRKMKTEHIDPAAESIERKQAGTLALVEAQTDRDPIDVRQQLFRRFIGLIAVGQGLGEAMVDEPQHSSIRHVGIARRNLPRHL